MRRIVLFLVLFILWLLLTWTSNWQSLLTGFIASFLIAILFGNLFVQEAEKFFQLKRWFWLFCYLLLFIWECIKANFDVAYRVLHPLMPIKPGIVKIRTYLKSDLAKTFLANSITMTPGTLSVDLDGEYLYIHWIYVRATDIEEASHKIIGRLEFLLAKVFD
jgi:multicomponent Na+:H+ antiporter subunit E